MRRATRRCIFLKYYTDGTTFDLNPYFPCRTVTNKKRFRNRFVIALAAQWENICKPSLQVNGNIVMKPIEEACEVSNPYWNETAN